MFRENPNRFECSFYANNIYKEFVNNVMDIVEKAMRSAYKSIYQFNVQSSLEDYTKVLIKESLRNIRLDMWKLMPKLVSDVQHIIEIDYKNNLNRYNKNINNYKIEIKELQQKRTNLINNIEKLEMEIKKLREEYYKYKKTYEKLKMEIDNILEEISDRSSAISISNYISNCKLNEIIPVESTDYLVLTRTDNQFRNRHYILIGGLIQVLEELKENTNKKQIFTSLNNLLVERFNSLQHNLLSIFVQNRDENILISITSKFWHDLLGYIYYIFIPFDMVGRIKFSLPLLDYNLIISTLLDIGNFVVRILSNPEFYSIVIPKIDYNLIKREVNIKEKILELLRLMHYQEKENCLELHSELSSLLDELDIVCNKYSRSSSLDVFKHIFIENLIRLVRDILNVSTKENIIICVIICRSLISYLNVLYREIEGV